MASVFERRIFTSADESFPPQSLYLILEFVLKPLKPLSFFFCKNQFKSTKKIVNDPTWCNFCSMLWILLQSSPQITLLLAIPIIGCDKQRNFLKERVNKLLEKQRSHTLPLNQLYYSSWSNQHDIPSHTKIMIKKKIH